MVCVCMCVVDIAHHTKKNIVVVVSTKTSRGDTFAQIKLKKMEQMHNFTSPFFFNLRNYLTYR